MSICRLICHDYRARVRGMSRLTERVKSLFRRPRPVTKEDSDRIADWVNEGGAVDPEGPPPIIGDEGETREP